MNFFLMNCLSFAWKLWFKENLFSTRASVVELVDALDSKSSVRKDVGVRFSPEAPAGLLQ